MTPNGPAPDPAKGRYLVIQIVRFTGVALTVLGVAVIAGKIDLPEVAGYAFVVAGVIDALVVPPILARKWRTPI
jgi:hypothetical protein